MSFKKNKSGSHCVGSRHRYATSKIYGDMTSKGKKVQIGYCSIGKRRKSMTVSDNIIQAEELGSFLKTLGRMSAEAG